jgi:hypothetical protein
MTVKERVLEADEWGDLDLMLDNAAADTLRALDEEEIATAGETLGEAWARHSAR